VGQINPRQNLYGALRLGGFFDRLADRAEEQHGLHKPGFGVNAGTHLLQCRMQFSTSGLDVRR